MFARRGLGSVTFDDVARETGLTRRTIYNHFANGTDLFAATVRDTLEQLRGWIPALVPDEPQPAARLDGLLRELLVLFCSESFMDLRAALSRDGEDHPALMQAFQSQLIDPLHNLLTASFEAGRRAASPGDPRRTALEMLTMLLGLADTSRLLGREGEDAIRHTLPIARGVSRALLEAQTVRLDRVA